MFSERLKLILDNQETTQVGLAKELGLSSQAINRWCQNITRPDYETLVKLANHFNVSVDFLLGNDQKSDATIEEEIKEKEILKKALIKTGYMKDEDDLTDEELKNLMEFVKTNKKYIKEYK